MAKECLAYQKCTVLTPTGPFHIFCARVCGGGANPAAASVVWYLRCAIGFRVPDLTVRAACITRWKGRIVEFMMRFFERGESLVKVKGYDGESLWIRRLLGDDWSELASCCRDRGRAAVYPATEASVTSPCTYHEGAA